MRVDEVQRSARQLNVLVLGNIAHLRGNSLRNIARPTFLGIDGYDPEGPIDVLAKGVPINS